MATAADIVKRPTSAGRRFVHSARSETSGGAPPDKVGDAIARLMSLARERLLIELLY